MKKCSNAAINGLVIFLLLISCSATFAEQQVAGIVTHLSGTLSVKKADGTVRLLATKSEVAEGDTLATEAGSYARVKFTDGAEVVLKPTTSLVINKFRYTEAKIESDAYSIGLLKGGLRAVTGLLGKRSPESVTVTARTATVGIRGTHFGMLDCIENSCADVQTVTGSPPQDGVHIDVADGRVLVKNSAGEQEVNAGQFAYVRDSSTPPVVVPPSEGIRVTMPTNISQNDAGGKSVGPSRFCSACSM